MNAEFAVNGDCEQEGEVGPGLAQAWADYSECRHQGLGHRDHQRLRAEKLTKLQGRFVFYTLDLYLTMSEPYEVPLEGFKTTRPRIRAPGRDFTKSGFTVNNCKSQGVSDGVL